MYGWKLKTFKLCERDKMHDWISKNQSKYEMHEVFINNALAIEYRPYLHF